MRLGFLGGTFDPPHLGHLQLAYDAIDAAHLDRLYFTPTYDSYHKSTHTDPQLRRTMCELMARVDDKLGVCDIDLERPGATYTVDTLRALHERLPNDELFWVCGADCLTSLTSWKEPQKILDLATLVVAHRPGSPVPALPQGFTGKLIILPSAGLDISSTLIRKEARQRALDPKLLPLAVYGFITDTGLYES